MKVFICGASEVQLLSWMKDVALHLLDVGGRHDAISDTGREERDVWNLYIITVASFSWRNVFRLPSFLSEKPPLSFDSLLHSVCMCVCVRKYLFVCPESRLFGPIFNSFSSSWITLWENCWATDAPHFLSFLASSLPLLWFIAVHKSLVCVIEMVFWSLRAFFTVFPTPLASIPLHRNSLALLTFILSNTSLTNWTGISSFSMCQSSGECLTAWDVF